MSLDFQIDVGGSTIGGRSTDGAVTSKPLLVGVHGGGFSSSYFDLGEFSFLDRAAAAGLPALAIDRPGHGRSSALTGDGQAITGNAELLNRAIGRLWHERQEESSGVVLIGHSIGSAVVLHIAAQARDWPLLGIAVSGIGLEPPPGIPPYWEDHAPDVWIPTPEEGWTHFMFGAEGTYPPDAPERVRRISLPVLSRELIEINTIWRDEVFDLCSRIRVPVQYRQGDSDILWANGPEENDRFARAFVNAPLVDAALVPGTGHCIDFHLKGAAFHQEQIEFAIRCAERLATA